MDHAKPKLTELKRKMNVSDSELRSLIEQKAGGYSEESRNSEGGDSKEKTGESEQSKGTEPEEKAGKKDASADQEGSGGETSESEGMGSDEVIEDSSSTSVPARRRVPEKGRNSGLKQESEE